MILYYTTIYIHIITASTKIKYFIFNAGQFDFYKSIHSNASCSRFNKINFLKFYFGEKLNWIKI